MDRAVIRRIESAILKSIPHHTTCRIEEDKRKYLREKEKERILCKIETMAGMEITFDDEWVKQDPDMSVCNVCKEVIYGPQYQLQYNICGETVVPEKPVKLCEPCYLKIDK